MKFFNIDCHISVIEDVKYIFKNLGHTVEDWSVSGHAHIMNKKKMSIKLKTGKVIDGCNHITRKIGQEFYDTFKDTLRDYDGFICCYPVEFCMLYELFNKPIIIVNCIRYEHPFTNSISNWNELNQVIKELEEKNLLKWVCNNKGDIEYTRYFTGISGNWIPSLCEYTSSFYKPEKDKYIIANRTSLSPKMLNNNAVHLYSIGNPFTWNDKCRYKGIIHIPYHNGTMSIFEEYTSNIPMFFPSKTLGKKLFNTPDKIMFNDLTFYRYLNIDEPEEESNPNHLRNEKNLNMWFDTCDFYDDENMPYLYYFDSLEHLNVLLNTLTNEDLLETSNKMKLFNESRKNIVYNKWKSILDDM